MINRRTLHEAYTSYKLRYANVKCPTWLATTCWDIRLLLKLLNWSFCYLKSNIWFLKYLQYLSKIHAYMKQVKCPSKRASQMSPKKGKSNVHEKEQVKCPWKRASQISLKKGKSNVPPNTSSLLFTQIVMLCAMYYKIIPQSFCFYYHSSNKSWIINCIKVESLLIRF